MLPPPVRPIGDLHLPQAQWSSLPNGIELCTRQGSSSHLCQLSITVRGGFSEAPFPAVASLLSSTITEGAAGRTSDEIASLLSFYGARLRAVAFQHHTVITLQVLSNKLRHVLPMLIDMLTSPDFPDEVVSNQRQREAMLLMQTEAQVAYLAQRALAPLIMGPDSPEAHFQTVEQVLSVTPNDLHNFHSQFYSGCNMGAFFFGEYSPEDLVYMVQQLSVIPKEPTQQPLNVYPYQALPPQRVDVIKADAQQSAVRMAIPAIPRTSPDYLPLRFAVMALGGYFGSRLNQNIREDKGYTYGIQSYLAGQLDGGIVYIGAQCDASYVDAVIDETANEMRLLAQKPMETAELDRVKQIVSMSLIDTIDTLFALGDYYRLKVLTNLPDGYFADQVRLVHALTPTDIQRMAQIYLNPDALRIAVAGKGVR